MDCVIAVRVTPKSSQNKMEVRADGTIRIWVSAPPVDGAANEAVCKLLSKAIGVAPSAISVLKGSQGRDKVISISGLTSDEVMLKLAGGTK